MERTSRSAISALSNCDRMGIAVWKAGAPCSVSSAAACAMPCILRLRSMMVMAAAAGSWRITASLPRAEAVIAGDVGLGLLRQHQGLGRLDRRDQGGCAIGEPVQQVQ